MKTMQRLGLTAVLLAVGTLFAAPPVLAGGTVYTIPLVAPAESPEPEASGVARVVYTKSSTPRTTVECVNLMPRERYFVCVITLGSNGGYYEQAYGVTTDRGGNLRVSFHVPWIDFGPVWVENDAGEIVLEMQ